MGVWQLARGERSCSAYCASPFSQHLKSSSMHSLATCTGVNRSFNFSGLYKSSCCLFRPGSDGQVDRLGELMLKLALSGSLIPLPVAFCVLGCEEHRKNIHPSTLIIFCLLFSVIFDAVLLRRPGIEQFRNGSL
ncbi:hypothetical protein M430DRAFT_257302 [Amorphotheca resinae ATCC 22711]|uniref:Uncharacterized protein n=1 Tax=Amorphotheca resinae ATCC 22711 TaxID=857342 RepID=A0A2T3AYJ0_AMORE|nr:hypothetical protein M430DRAFT_257302 [Amorphotheca resinae ATCC 22711]PSS15134.1 hypothetical protein M430DRAFT_257302 [Amorphotheca resinae ATCC 22711]